MIDTDVPEDDEEDEEFVTQLDKDILRDPTHDPDNLDPPSAPLPSHPQPPPSQSKRRIPPYCQVIQPKLRALLYALFTQLPGPHASGRFFSPLIRYLVLASFDTEGKWAISGNITQYIASLLFTGRLTLYSEMQQGLSGTEYEDFHL